MGYGGHFVAGWVINEPAWLQLARVTWVPAEIPPPWSAFASAGVLSPPWPDKIRRRINHPPAGP
jgi:hypothetical protein